MTWTDLLTPRDLEERYKHFKEATWRLWLRQRRLDSVSIGRRVLVRPQDADAFIEAHMRGAATNGAVTVQATPPTPRTRPTPRATPKRPKKAKARR